MNNTTTGNQPNHSKGKNSPNISKTPNANLSGSQNLFFSNFMNSSQQNTWTGSNPNNTYSGNARTHSAHHSPDIQKDCYNSMYSGKPTNPTKSPASNNHRQQVFGQFVKQYNFSKNA